MTKVVLDSQLDSVLHRRRHLRYQRRLKLLQAGWRTLAIISLAGGLAWAVSLPDWVIRQPDQVWIRGNRLLSTSAIQSLLPLSFPQSIIRLQSEPVVKTLNLKAPIDKVTVARQLFPPKLIVSVQERDPVAVLPCNPSKLAKSYDCSSTQKLSKLFFTKQRSANIWLLDSHGIAMPLESYPTLQQSRQLPELAILGLLEPGVYGQVAKDTPSVQDGLKTKTLTSQSEQSPAIVDQRKKSQWPQLYEAVRRSPVRVSEIDWRDETNLILKTELGIVHVGPYSSKFSSQLETLGQMRSLPKYTNPKQVKYIDLKNLKNPLLQMNNAR